MFKTIVFCSLIVVPFSFVLADEKAPPPKTEENLLKKAEGLWEKYNPFKIESKTQPEESEIANKLPTEPFQLEPVKPIEPPSESSDFRLIPSFGLGSIEMTSGKKTDDINRSFNPNPSVSLSVLGDYRYPPGPYSFEFGIGFLSISSDVAGFSQSSMDLMYFTIPMSLRYNFSNFGKGSKLFFKAGLTPALLFSARVNSCTAVACGLDDDLDAFFSESRSVSGLFNQQDVLASIGIGMDAHIFDDFLIDAMWFMADVTYYQGLLKINSGSELGSNIYNHGLQAHLGIALDF